MRKPLARTKNGQRGFTLVELLIVTAILVTIFAVITQGIVNLQRRNSAEVAKTDMTEQARDFVDQATRDIHQAGYPAARTIVGTNSQDKRVAAGLMSVNSYWIQFEADVDGSGTVSEVVIQLVDSAGTVGGATCPCTMQRGVIDKVTGGLTVQGAPTFYTELGNVTNTTTAIPIFSAYRKDGTQVALPVDVTTVAGQAAVSSIRTVQMTVNIQSPNKDLTTKVAPTLALTSQARIVNF